MHAIYAFASHIYLLRKINKTHQQQQQKRDGGRRQQQTVTAAAAANVNNNTNNARHCKHFKRERPPQWMHRVWNLRMHACVLRSLPYAICVILCVFVYVPCDSVWVELVFQVSAKISMNSATTRSVRVRAQLFNPEGATFVHPPTYRVQQSKHVVR